MYSALTAHFYMSNIHEDKSNNHCSTSLFASFSTCITYTKYMIVQCTCQGKIICLNCTCYKYIPCNYNLYFYLLNLSYKTKPNKATCIIYVHIFNLTISRRVIAAAFSMASCWFLICDP